MIRCAWILTDLVGGGAERVPLVLGPALRTSELTLLLLKNRVEHELPPGAPRVVALSSGERSLAVAGPSILLRSARAARDADVLVAGLEWAPTFFARACGALARRPVVATVHVDLRRYHELEPVPRRWWTAMRLALRSCAAVVAVSEDVRESVLGLDVDERRVHVIPNPIAPQRVARQPRGVRPRLLTVAGLKPIKGVDVAVEAAARLEGLDFEWTIVGDGPERGRLEALARELGVAGRVRFLGFRPDPQPFYAAADVYVLPSRVEGNPLVLLEAMGAGLPVVATRCAGAVEEHLRGGAGELVPVGDAEALAAAVRSLLADPARRERLGETGRKRARAYAPEVVAARYDALLADVVAGS